MKQVAEHTQFLQYAYWYEHILGIPNPKVQHTEKYKNFSIHLVNESHLASYQQQDTAGYF